MQDTRPTASEIDLPSAADGDALSRALGSERSDATSDRARVADRLVVAVIGGGPAGLMAAETIATAGFDVDVFDAMPSVGRKFLMAGKGGMNLTHSEPLDAFLSRYGARRAD